MPLVAVSRLLLLPIGSRGSEAPRIRTPRSPHAAPTSPLRLPSSPFRCACCPSRGGGSDKDSSARHLFDEFSVISPVTPWEIDEIWRTYAAYFCILHVPLSFGGLGVVAKALHCSSLDAMTTVISTFIFQLAELSLALALLQYTAMPDHDVQAFFAGKFSTKQSWIKETLLGFGILMSLVSITSIIADIFVGTEDGYDPILKEILSNNPITRLACFFLYCVIAPLSEETIYRGFLLTSLSSSMKWPDAVVISSLAFSVAHLSGKSFIQLFIIGCITGLAYCRTGTLVASFTIHSLYNAVILYMALVS
ncbi:hypothetical protein ACP4OV_014305 [Aristida adscensionis]